MKTFFTKNMFKFLSSLSIKFVKLPSLEILKIRLSKALSILTGVVLTLRVWIRRPLDVSSNLHFSKILTSSCGSCPVGSCCVSRPSVDPTQCLHMPLELAAANWLQYFRHAPCSVRLERVAVSLCL